MSENQEIPSGWTLVKLGELVVDPKKDLVDGPFGSNLKADEYTDSGVPVFKIQNIKANQFLDKNINYITEEKAKSLSRHSFISGDLIITKLGYPLGLCCKVPEKYRYGIIVADLMRLRPNALFVNDQFLIYAINCNVVQNQFKAITKGTTRPRVNLTIVREIELALPPLPEQHRIVAKIEELFSSLDKGIESLKTVQQQLKIYRQAVLKWAFEGKLTNNTLRQAQGTILPVGEAMPAVEVMPMVEPVETTLSKEGKLPEGWKWVLITDLIEKNDKHALKAGPFGSSLKKEFYVTQGYKIYGQEQVIGGNPFYGDYYINEDKYQELSSNKIKPFDILISLVGTVGKVLILPENCLAGIINPRLIKVSLDTNIYLPKFFKYYFESSTVKSFYSSKAQGTTMDVLNISIIKTIYFPLCSLPEQHAIVAEIESRLSVCDKIEESIEQSLKQAESLRQSILKKAFAGKLVPQDPNDEPAAKLLERIKMEKEKTVSKKRSCK